MCSEITNRPCPWNGAVANPTLAQHVAYAIYCVKEVFPDKEWNERANNWLSGEDRSVDASEKAQDVALGIMRDLEVEAEYDKQAEKAYNVAVGAANAAYASQHLEAASRNKLSFEWCVECQKWARYAVDRVRSSVDVDKCSEKAMRVR